jgi:glycosyltransferase 2 family protein
MKYITWKNLILFVILAVAVFVALIFIGDYHTILDSLSKISLAVVLAILGLTTLNYILRFIKWEYFLRRSKIFISLKHSLLIWFSGLSMAITPGKVGEFFKSQLLKDTDGIPRTNSLMIVFLERLTDVIGLCILSLIGLLTLFRNTFSQQIIILIAISAVVIAGVIILTNESLCMRFLVISKRLPLIHKYTDNITEVYQSSKGLFTFRPFATAILLSVVSWFFECLALYLLLLNLGIDIGISSAMFIFSFSSIFGSVLVLPGGLGAAEGSFMIFLVAEHVPVDIASLATIIFRICTLFFGVIVGIVCLSFLNREIGKKQWV